MRYLDTALNHSRKRQWVNPQKKKTPKKMKSWFPGPGYCDICGYSHIKKGNWITPWKNTWASYDCLIRKLENENKIASKKRRRLVVFKDTTGQSTPEQVKPA